ncbi:MULTISPECIES: hypothetical protein [Yersinia]|uniref:hypothetical protein n=1 Tax=Yersinia TaxID=629 RepID=UPI0005DC3852|nr:MULTISPECIES: hypothetical protein [Yersinia]CFQ33572.1 Uncharacterised protein [Yersinia aleksiciae]CNG50889.1 Uncharacterised protein [Yersinia kristensenii]CNK27018.1 Uncharacterised protein [Yersinia kristensenii]
MKINGHTTTTFGIELKMFRGEFIGLNGALISMLTVWWIWRMGGDISGGVFG